MTQPENEQGEVLEEGSEVGVESPPESAEAARAGESGGGVAGGEEESGGGDGRLGELEEEISRLNERHLRLAAEFDNFRKRTERERSGLWKRAQAELVGSLLDVLDDLQRWTEQDPAGTTTEALHEAGALVERKFRRVLESAGLETIEAEGRPFDPEEMEALMTLPAETEEEDEVVADVFQAGYRFGDRLIRPARVRVKQYEG